MQVIELMLKIGCGFDCVLVEWGREVLNRGVGVRDVEMFVKVADEAFQTKDLSVDVMLRRSEVGKACEYRGGRARRRFRRVTGRGEVVRRDRGGGAVRR